MLSPNNDLHTIQRELEICTEAFESLETIASSHEISSNQLGDIMTPLCLNLGNVIDKLQLFQDGGTAPITSKFVNQRRDRPRIDLIATGRDQIKKASSED